MSFCATCGRPRTGTALFCAGCGARFADAGDTPDQSATPESGSAETRWDTRVDMPGGQAPPAAAPTQPSSPFPPPPGPGQYPGPMPNQPAPSSPRRGGSGILIGLVIVLVIAVGGGAFALVSALTKNKAAAPPPGQPTSGAPTSSAPTASATASSSASASASSTVSPATGSSTVAVSRAAAANPAAPQVQALVKHYFAAINAHDFTAYNSIHDAKSQMAQSTFDSGYATTSDSAEELTAISDAGGGELAATVAFVSHQDPAKSINNSSCTKWTIMLYLIPQGSSYLITSTPPGYHAVYAAC